MDRIGTGFITSQGIADNTKEIVLQAEGTAVTANGSVAGVDVSSYKEALLFIDVTAVTGSTPTLNLYVETYDFNSAKWYTVPGVTIAQITAAGQVVAALTNFGETIRLRAVVGGTSPSFTYGASVVAKS